MNNSIIKLACGALLLTITFTACTTAQAETAVTPTPTPAPTISPEELREKAVKSVIREISDNIVEVSTSGQKIYIANTIAEGATEIETILPIPAMAYDELGEEMLTILDNILDSYIEPAKNGEIEESTAIAEQDALVQEKIVSRELPINGVSLLEEHRQKTGYKEKLQPDPTPTPAPQETDNNNGGGGGNDWGGGGNAPQPSGGGNSGGNSGGNYNPVPDVGGYTDGTTPSGIPGGASIEDGEFIFIEGMW